MNNQRKLQSVLLTSNIVKFFTKSSDQRERVLAGGAVARIGWRSCRRVVRTLVFLLPAIFTSHLAADDWPTYRGDNHRSGVSPESLKLPLEETWMHTAGHRPRPAWPELPAREDIFRRIGSLRPTSTYDRAFHVVVAGGSLYYASSADDMVHCHDVSTGRRRWSFATEGPVHLAPAVAGGRVYAGSDDGCVYCLDGADGSLLWKRRAGPADRRLPGNGRLISLWPVRCGIVVDGGVVYVAAGLFPSQGVYLCALGAVDGKEIWKRKIDVSSQGYLLASRRRLFVPTGRTPPCIFERPSGKPIGGLPGGGGCFAVLVDDVLVHSGGETGGIHLSGAGPKEKIVSASGARLIAHGPTAYILDKNRLRALDRAGYTELSRQIAPLQRKKKKSDEDQKLIRELAKKQQACWKWDVPCSAGCELIMAGDVIFAGGENQVVAYSAADGKRLWTGSVSGKAYGLAPSGGRLFVSTDKGTIHCFEPKTARRGPAVASQAPGKASPPPYPQDRWTSLYKKAAATAVNAAGTKKGYCLVLGAGTGRLAYEIANRSEFQIVGLEPDARKVATARKLLGQAGLYGSRITIHHGRLDKLPYQKYFANLITSDETLTSGKLPPEPEEVFRVLRPCGGVAVFGGPKAPDPQSLKNWPAGAIPGWKVEKADDAWIGIVRRGRLEGAGEWTHFYADSGNSACSTDALGQGPVDIQWFGRPGPRKMVDRHEKNVAPLYKNGRLFVTGNNCIVTLDAYNGTVLWECDLPDSIRLGAPKDCGNMVATDEHLYVASGSRCVAFDVQTGGKKLTLSVPAAADDGKREWGYIATAGDVLFGSATKPGAAMRVQDIDTQVLMWRDYKPVVCSDHLFALDRHTGKQLWTYAPTEGVIINSTIAVGGSRVYCVQSANPQTRKVADGRIKLDVLLGEGSNLVALDIQTGKILWKKPAALEALQHAIFMSYAKETLVVTGTKNVSVVDGKRVRYDLCAFSAATGEPLWQTTQTPVPDHILDGPHGEQVQHSAIVGETIYSTGFACELRTGKPIAGWKWVKSEKCGTLSASASCLFSRFSNPRMFDLATGKFTSLTSVTRPGCWINIIPAGGLILIPEASSGCTCGYSIQTSLALVPRDEKP